jgi:hypothetical protein
MCVKKVPHFKPDFHPSSSVTYGCPSMMLKQNQLRCLWTFTKSHRHFKINNLQRCCLVLNISSGGDYCLVLGKSCPHSYILKLEPNLSLLQINLRVIVESSYSPFSCAIATILIVACSQMWAYSWMLTVISH